MSPELRIYDFVKRYLIDRQYNWQQYYSDDFVDVNQRIIRPATSIFIGQLPTTTEITDCRPRPCSFTKFTVRNVRKKPAFLKVNKS